MMEAESIITKDNSTILTDSTCNQTSTSSNTEDEEAKRRKIMSKLWGKGNKSSHKVRELDKSIMNNNSESSSHQEHDGHEALDVSDNQSSFSSANDSRNSSEDGANSINTNKPFAVVKPIIMMKSGALISSTSERLRVNSEASSVVESQTDVNTSETIASGTHGQQSTSSSENTEQASRRTTNKQNIAESNKSKKDRSKSKERNHSKHRNDELQGRTNRDSKSNFKRDQSDYTKTSYNVDHRDRPAHREFSSTVSTNKTEHSSSSKNNDRPTRESSRSHKDELSSSKSSPKISRDRQKSRSRSRHSKERRHGHRKSRSSSRSPRRSHKTSNNTWNSRRTSTPSKVDHKQKSESSKTAHHRKDSVSNSKSNNDTVSSTSRTEIEHGNRENSIERNHDNSQNRSKIMTHDDKTNEGSRTKKSYQESPLRHRSTSNSISCSKSKTSNNHEITTSVEQRPKVTDYNESNRARSRSNTPEKQLDKKQIELSSLRNHTSTEKKVRDKTSRDRRSTRESPMATTSDRHHRKSSSESYQNYRRHSSSYDDRRRDYHDRNHSNHHRSYHHRTYDNHHPSSSSKYHDYRHRSPSSRTNHHCHRRYSSSSSSTSISSYRRSPSRTSSSSRSSSSYSSVSRTPSSLSRSRSRNSPYHRRKRFRRSPTLERILLKASESIESVSTQKNPTINQDQSIPVRTSAPITTNSQISSQLTTSTDTDSFYPNTFSGFSVPPPPFVAQSQQRCLKQITTDEPVHQRPVLNELQMPTTLTNSFNNQINSESENMTKISTSNDNLMNVQLPGQKGPRISRFSDIITVPVASPTANTDIPLDASLNYTKINDSINCLPSNLRLRKRHNREVMECECTTNEEDRVRGIKACGSECLNRMLLIECGPNCPCGQYCTNRRFQRRSYASHKLVLFKTDMKGVGIRTTASIRKGRFLVEYVGEVIDMDELTRRNKKYKRSGQTHQYVMSLNHGTVIDSTTKGNWARFINHSCEPNCTAEKWLVNGEYRMGLFAKRDLNAGEEITIDYRFEASGNIDLINSKCYCGAATCRGTISVRKSDKNNVNSTKRSNRRQSLDDDELIVYLRDDDTNEYIIPKTLDEIRQLIQIMSRTDGEHIRLMELDLLRHGSQKQLELARLFLECNGLHVLSSWMKDILIQTDDQIDDQQYSDKFKHSLLDFMDQVLPIKDRTTVTKHHLLNLVKESLTLPSKDIKIELDDQEQIKELVNSMVDHLSDPLVSKLFNLHSKWNSLKDRFVIPKRKNPQGSSEQESYRQHSHHHHHHHQHQHQHHRHSSRHDQDENYHRSYSGYRSSTSHRRSRERSDSTRPLTTRNNYRNHEPILSIEERRRLIEQQFEDAEREKVAAATRPPPVAGTDNEVTNLQQEPPYKKQRIFDGAGTASSTSETNLQQPSQADFTNWLHQHLSQIPFDYIRSYLISIGQWQSNPTDPLPKKENTVVPPPVSSQNENELSKILRLPADWSVALCPSDSSVYFYNEQMNTSSWTPPISLPPGWLPTPREKDNHDRETLHLSPLSSAQINEHQRIHHSHKDSSLLLLTTKPPRLYNRHHRSHRHHHDMNINHKRKRPLTTGLVSADHNDSNVILTKEKLHEYNEQINVGDENSDSIQKQVSTIDPISVADNLDQPNPSTSKLNVNDGHVLSDDQVSSHSHHIHASTLPSETNRDLLRRSISQHVHATLKPFTKRTCKQGRITSADDMKYLVKKFTLVVLDKEVEKAKNDGVPLSSVLTDRVRLKTDVYIKKYMNKMGLVFQRHDGNVSHRSAPQNSEQQMHPSPIPTITTSTE